MYIMQHSSIMHTIIRIAIIIWNFDITNGRVFYNVNMCSIRYFHCERLGKKISTYLCPRNFRDVFLQGLPFQNLNSEQHLQTALQTDDPSQEWSPSCRMNQLCNKICKLEKRFSLKFFSNCEN